jgi:hypothetical protein
MFLWNLDDVNIEQRSAICHVTLWTEQNTPSLTAIWEKMNQKRKLTVITKLVG